MLLNKTNGSKVPIYLLLFIGVICLNGLANQAFAQTAQSISKVSITVSDLDKTVPFYTKVLSFKEINRFQLKDKAASRLFGLKRKNLPVEIVQLQLGNELIELVEFNKKGRTIPPDSKSNDLWFQHIAIVVSDMEKAYQVLKAHEVEHVSTAPQTLPDYIPAAAGISAFYFEDPDGHNLELIYFPEGKGNPKWQQPTEKIFLGIDHSAIGIDRTSNSLNFYEKLIGLKVAGNSENYGTEQEHLNQVFGARLLITGLVAQNGFGLEFLDYIAPQGGRIYPDDSQVNDIWHWHTSIKIENIERYYHAILNSNYQVISKGIISLNNKDLNVQKAFIARGPDGHALLFYE